MVLVMSADSEDVDGRIIEAVNQAIPMGQTAGPKSRKIVLQGFRLAGTHAGVTALKLFENSAEMAMEQLIASPQGLVSFPGVALKDNRSHRIPPV